MEILRFAQNDKVGGAVAGKAGKFPVFSHFLLDFRRDKHFTVTEVGLFSPKMMPKESLSSGEVGYICASIKVTSWHRSKLQ